MALYTKIKKFEITYNVDGRNMKLPTLELQGVEKKSVRVGNYNVSFETCGSKNPIFYDTNNKKHIMDASKIYRTELDQGSIQVRIKNSVAINKGMLLEMTLALVVCQFAVLLAFNTGFINPVVAKSDSKSKSAEKSRNIASADEDSNSSTSKIDNEDQNEADTTKQRRSFKAERAAADADKLRAERAAYAKVLQRKQADLDRIKKDKQKKVKKARMVRLKKRQAKARKIELAQLKKKKKEQAKQAELARLKRKKLEVTQKLELVRAKKKEAARTAELARIQKRKQQQAEIKEIARSKKMKEKEERALKALMAQQKAQKQKLDKIMSEKNQQKIELAAMSIDKEKSDKSSKRERQSQVAKSRFIQGQSSKSAPPRMVASLDPKKKMKKTKLLNSRGQWITQMVEIEDENNVAPVSSRQQRKEASMAKKQAMHAAKMISLSH